MNTINLKTELDIAKMSYEDSRKWYHMAQILQKYTFPMKPSSDGYFHVYVEDDSKPSGRRAVKAKTLEALKEKVYKYNLHTFVDCFKLMENEKLKYVKNVEKQYSVSNTISVLNSTYKRFFEGSEFEMLPVEEIGKSDIEKFSFEVLSKYNLTKKGFLSFRGIIRQTLKYAFSQYLIEENPYDRVNFTKYNDMLVEPLSVSERVHSESEVDKIFEELRRIHDAKPDYIVAYALELQILMGLRRGEVAPLQKSDIHDRFIVINKEQITVKKSENIIHERDKIVHHTKTHQDRLFPITSTIQEFLDQYLPIVDEYDVLFPANTESGVISNRSIYKLYQRICRRLGIQISRECIRGTHSFRRNQITKVANETGDMMLTAQMFGNSPITIQKNYYTGYDLEKGRLALEG